MKIILAHMPTLTIKSLFLVFCAIICSFKLFSQNHASFIEPLTKLKYSSAQAVGIDSAFLYHKIDSIANYAIQKGVAPGIQVLVARHGHIVLHNTYGFHTYDSIKKVEKEDLYDWASVTKITAGLPALMQLYDQNKFSLDATMGTYLPYFNKGNKKDLTYRKILSHHALLKPWIPYWTTTLKKNGNYKNKTLTHLKKEGYDIEIVPGLYLYNNYKANIYKQILKTELNKNKGYQYSGLIFYLIPEIVEKLSSEKFADYLKKNVYEPIGASTITFNPLEKFNKDHIIPTEIDTFFRMHPLHGTVHDEGAAMMNGISSNAGLFGSTIDLAKMMQMYMWMGKYDSMQIISPHTMDLFTTRHYANEGNRRGLGFDKPVLTNKENGSTAKDASEKSFGHSGYTGTFAWSDPENGILFVFMSNRVYPTRANTKIYQLNIRPTMHQAIYDALEKQ